MRLFIRYSSLKSYLRCVALATLTASWFFWVAPTDLSKPWAKFRYNSDFGCQDWLGGANEQTKQHPNGYVGSAGVGLGADGNPGTKCGTDGGDISGWGYWAYVFYPDEGGAYKIGFQDRGACLGARSSAKKRGYPNHSFWKKHGYGLVSADCLYMGDTYE
jgi:hypothetical protein